MLRRDPHRERALLRIIEDQQRTIRELTEQVMFLAGKPWLSEPDVFEPAEVALPREWTATPEQEPSY